MLGRNHYEQDYIDRSRERIGAQLAAYDALKAKAKGADAEIAAFEPLFLNDLVQVLDHLFVHRLRKMEGKDGNPLNEVRALCDSLMSNGDEVRLDEDGFRRLSDGFFAEIESRFGG
jgi:hypothetical protein